MARHFKIESLLSARLFLSPQLVDNRIYFMSNLSGRIGLYAMDKGGSVPEPLLPLDIALQNPVLVHESDFFFVFPKLGKIMVMIDKDGDENYQPCWIPLLGGIPEPVFGDRFVGQQVFVTEADLEHNRVMLLVDHRTAPIYESFVADLEKGTLVSLGASPYGNACLAADKDYRQFILADGYMGGDNVLYYRGVEDTERRLIYGMPLEERSAGVEVVRTAFKAGHLLEDGSGVLVITSRFDDQLSLGYLPMDRTQTVEPVKVMGTVHRGSGEMDNLIYLEGLRYLVIFNIDGCSYAYEGAFDPAALVFHVDRVICGVGELHDGVLQHVSYEKASGAYALAFCSATMPVQLYILERDGTLAVQTRERMVGIPMDLLAPGEDASFISHDGLRISARLYLPAPILGFEGRRPVVFYVHGGPQGQERPDSTWFSMPLIQFLTLRGFAVFVPNVRGSSGYGLNYMRQVDRDWGGKDRLDHVAAWHHLHEDPRLDLERAAIVGRSYGGYMTLTQVGRHPELWKAGCDMFGPYNLATFIERLPETWKTHFYLTVGNPETEAAELEKRSPSSYLDQLACPLLVIQGANDPRVRLAESEDLVKRLQAQGKQVELLIFENEGHDVIKFENKVRCYNAIVDFFARILQP